MKSKRKGSVLDDLGTPLTVTNLHVLQPQTRHCNKDHFKESPPY